MAGVTFYKNPKIDYLFIHHNGNPIPTKQDKFVPVEVSEILADGTEQALNNFYIKKPDTDAVIEFNNLIKTIALKNFPKENKILKPNEVEILISVSITEKRYREVDIDNLAKCVLDTLNDIVYEDDSQVSRLICSKHVHPMKVNGIMIGITQLTDMRRGVGGDIKLLSNTPW